MTDSNPQVQVEAAKAYEALFVPALFEQWAPHIADAARIHAGDRVLDVACGTGVLAREVATRVGPVGHAVGVDPNRGMLEVAQQLSPGVEWGAGTAEALPYADETFDAVVSQFGLMFFTDRARALREMLRVLNAKGRLAVAVWNSLDSMPAYAAEVALLDRLAGPAAADALRAPFVLGDRHAMEMLFKDASVGSVRVVTQSGTARFPNIRSMVEADLRGWLPVMGVVLPAEQIEHILEQADQVLRPHVSEPATFELSAHIVTGNK